MRGSELGEPLIDVFFDDVVENRNSAFMGFEVLSKDRNANGRVSGAYVGKYVIEVATLM